MKREWAHLCEELFQFIKQHDKIRLIPNETVIPDDRKIPFYDLFNRVRSALIAHWNPDFYSEVSNLRRSLAQAEAKVIKRLNLDQVILPIALQRFLKDPENLLMGVLFHLLFDHLKGKLDEKELETQALLHLQNRYHALYQSSYQKWTTLVLLNQLEADRNYRVNVPLLEISAKGPVERWEPAPTPIPEESNVLAYQTENTAAFWVPEIIVHSKKNDRFFAFRANLENIVIASEVLWTAAEHAEKRKWYPFEMFKRSLKLRSAKFIFVNKHLEDAGLVADSQCIAQPDAILEIMSPDESLMDAQKRVALYKKHLKPKLGVFIIMLSTTSRSPFEVSSDDGIKVVTPGMEDSNLKCIAETLIEDTY
jgi:hypothetical protein